jgi:hypothetical protein
MRSVRAIEHADIVCILIMTLVDLKVRIKVFFGWLKKEERLLFLLTNAGFGRKGIHVERL